MFFSDHIVEYYAKLCVIGPTGRVDRWISQNLLRIMITLMRKVL